jgi:hypothetical protein
MAARREQRQSKVADERIMKKPEAQQPTIPQTPVAAVVAEAESVAPVFTSSAAPVESAAEQSLCLGLDSILTMTPEQIEKVSPTGQFSKLKLALLEPPKDLQEKKAAGEVIARPANEAGLPRKTCLNDLLTMDCVRLEELSL